MKRLCIFASLALLASPVHAADIITFRTINRHNDAYQAKAQNGVQESIPGWEVVTNSVGLHTNLFWVNKRYEFSDRSFDHIDIYTNESKTISVVFSLTNKGKRFFASPEQIPSYERQLFAIFYGTNVLIAPLRGEPWIAGSFTIDGVFSESTAHELKKTFEEAKAGDTHQK